MKSWGFGSVVECLQTHEGSGIKPLPCKEKESAWRISIAHTVLGKGRCSCVRTQKCLLLAVNPLSHSLLCQEPSLQPLQATEPLQLPHLAKGRNYHCGAHTKSSAQGTDCLPESSQWAFLMCCFMATVCWGNTLLENLSLSQLYKLIQLRATAL